MSQHLIDLIKGLDRNRFEPVVIAPPGHKMGDELLKIGTPIYEADFPGRPNPIKVTRAVCRLAKLFKKLEPDIIHAHGHMATMVGIPARRLTARTTPIIVSVHNYPSYQEARGFKRAFGTTVQRFLSHRASYLIAVSEDIRLNMVNEEGIDPATIVTVHNGIDLADLPERPKTAAINDVRKRHGIRADEKVVGAIGRLVAFKGFSVLLEAVALLKVKRRRFKVMIVGRGPENENLERQIATLGIKDVVIMPGFVPDIAPYFAISDVFVVPSIREPFGLIVLQAMAAGRPVVGANAGGIPEIIRDGVTGILVPPNDASALTEAIDGLLDDANRCRRLAAAAEQDLREHFSIEVMVAKTQEIYERCLKRE
jgi:glycosyltransferase involved in cell wall biosynthesis